MESGSDYSRGELLEFDKSQKNDLKVTRFRTTPTKGPRFIGAGKLPSLEKVEGSWYPQREVGQSRPREHFFKKTGDSSTPNNT